MQTEREQQPISTTGEFRIVSINQVTPSKTNPRKHFAKDALQDLTKSVKEKGILVPLLVREKEGGFTRPGYEVIAGERRYRAAIAAELKDIPVIIRVLDDEQALEVQVIENLQREDVHPLEEAEGYKQLLAKGKYEVEGLADKIGKSVSYIYQRLKLAELVPAAKKAFLEEKITAGHAILIARLQAEEQKQALEYSTERWNKPSVRDLSDWILREVHLDLAKAPWKKDDATLLPAAGACTTCPKRTGANPGLFPDVKKGDTCTDPTCFHQKADALIKQRVKENPGVQLISTESGYSGNDDKRLAKAGILRSYDYRKAGAIKCKDTVEGLIVEGEGSGTRIRICTQKRCKKHNPSEQSYRSKPRSPKEIAAEKKRQEKQQLEDRVEQLAFVAAIRKVIGLKTFPPALWRILAVGLWNCSYGYDDSTEML
jgi:ParB family chromosome partitioning protein